MTRWSAPGGGACVAGRRDCVDAGAAGRGAGLVVGAEGGGEGGVG